MPGLIYRIKFHYKRLFGKKIIIPTYDEKRAVIKQYADEFQVRTLVETGTFMGDTVEYFKTRFKKIISIELSEELAMKAIERFKNNPNVTIIKGDSGVELSSILKGNTEPFLFWLDGHYSHSCNVNGSFIVTGKGELDTPIELELKSILSTNPKHVILIDDARCFNGEGDYPSIKHIKKIFEKSGKKYNVFIENDIIRALPL